MPKQVLKIENFHGGLNSSADPRDISDGELTTATDLMVDTVGSVRTMGSVVAHSVADKTLDNTGAGVTQVPGSGLFHFSHDRKGGEDAGDAEAEVGDNYLALYDDTDVQVWVYSEAVDDWDDDKDSNDNGVINFIGKTTSSAARPCFTSIDGAIRVSTGEFSKYDAGTDINMGSHLLVTATALTVDDGTQFAVGNYIQIDDEILFVSAISTHVLTVVRAMFGTRDVQHQDGADIYILNMNQWYGYINNKFFQTSAGAAEYTTNGWYNEVQHLRSFDELGITLELHDSSSEGPDSTLAAYKIVVSHWPAPDGFWSGSYYLGLTPVYIGGQEGPISTVGSTAISLAEQTLNVQLYVCHPSLTNTVIGTHPLKDDRIIGVNLYTKSYTSNEWFLLKKFDLIEGGEYGWKQYLDGNKTAGIWTDGSAVLASPASDQSYARTTVAVTVTPGTDMGDDRTGIVRISGFYVSPVYTTVDLGSTSAQANTIAVVNPTFGTAPFVIEVLDENYDLLHTTQTTKSIADSGINSPHYPETTQTGEEVYHSECFLQCTQILMSSGSMKNISDIEIGDIVASYSRHYNSYVSGIVTDVLLHPIGDVARVAVIGNSLYGTPSHPILVNDRWVEIHHSGLDIVYNYVYVDTYYNLEIDGDNIFNSDHNYIANGYIVSGLGDNDILNKAIPRQTIFIGR